MANLSLCDKMINHLDSVYQDRKAANAAHTALLALDDATTFIGLAKDGCTGCISIALNILIAADLVEEADDLFVMWWES